MLSCFFLLADNEEPNITCPDNDTVTTDSGQNFTLFALPPEVSAVDNSELQVTITIDVDGVMYSVGDSVQLDLADSPHLVQYTATDNSSNTATCDTYVTVNGRYIPVGKFVYGSNTFCAYNVPLVHAL